MLLKERILGCTEHFDAAHFLPGYQGKCANVHGHTWHITVEIRGEVQADGMVMDLSNLKNIVKIAIAPFDHALINSLDFMTPAVVNPTCENLISWIYERIYMHPCFSNPTPLYHIHSIELREGDGGYARWEETI